MTARERRRQVAGEGLKLGASLVGSPALDDDHGHVRRDRCEE